MTRKAFDEALDKACVEVTAEKHRRGHLGASSLGSKCARQLWYGFNWYYEEQFDGRMKRLFSRGHEEEFRFARWLRAMGIEVQDYAERLIYNHAGCCYEAIPWDASYFGNNPDLQDCSESQAHITIALAAGVKLKQWGFGVDIGQSVDGPVPTRDGHFSGSTDGRVLGVDRWYPEVTDMGWGLLEEKTHSSKSFSTMAGTKKKWDSPRIFNADKNGVLKSKPKHYIQMQMYMHFMGLKWGLYMAVNKDNDEVYTEIVMYRPEVATPYAERAMKIVELRAPPQRISRDPSWHECRFCSYKDICHYDKPPEANCRSCAFSSAEPGVVWYCNKHKSDIPKAYQSSLCQSWEKVIE